MERLIPRRGLTRTSVAKPAVHSSPAKAGIQRGGEEWGIRHSGHPPKTAGRPFVIPAKAGIQRGGEGAWQGPPGCRSPTHLPKSAQAPPLRHAGPPPSSFRRRPESRGAVGSGANLLQCIGGQAGLPTTPAHPRHSGEGRNPEGRRGARQALPTTPGPPLRHSGPPPSSFRRRPESRGAVRGEALPRQTDFSSASEAKPASQQRRPPPDFVIPAKAGIQRGGEECGNLHRSPTHLPAPHHVHHSGEGRNPEGRWATGQPRPPTCRPHPTSTQLKSH